MKADEMLDLPMGENDAGVRTIREYFHKLLYTLMEEDEGFSGKRPFGNSGWRYEIIYPLVKYGAIAGYLDGDDDGFEGVESYDEEEFEEAWKVMLNHLFLKPIQATINKEFFEGL